MLSRYRLRRRVQFYETDLAGIVHFSWYFRYMEEAEHAMWRHAGLSISKADEDYGFPRVAASFDYKAPLRFEDEFDVLIKVAAMSRRTMRYACVMTRGETTIATGGTTIVCATKKPGEPIKAIAIPPEIAAHFAVDPGAAEEPSS